MTFLERWFDEVWNKRDEAAIDNLALPNAMTHGLEHPEGDVVPDREAFKDFHRKLCSIFSKIHVDVKHSITVNDLDMAACEVTAVLPATDGREEKTVKFTGLCVARIKDGKLAEGWNHFDFPTMYQHL
jgi:hypothetical protein